MDPWSSSEPKNASSSTEIHSDSADYWRPQALLSLYHILPLIISVLQLVDRSHPNCGEDLSSPIGLETKL